MVNTTHGQCTEITAGAEKLIDTGMISYSQISSYILNICVQMLTLFIHIILKNLLMLLLI